MTVLILDDEVVSVEIMKTQIHWGSCGIDRVLEAYNADSARKLLTSNEAGAGSEKNNSIDIILCDIEMPGKNGISFMQWVREEGYDMECIFLTCHAKFEYAQEAVRLGSLDYVLKPAPFDEMEEKIRRAAEKRRKQGHNRQMQQAGEEWVRGQKNYIQEHYGEVHSKESIAASAEQYVQSHLSDSSLSVSVIADELAMNADYLGAVFKQVKGITLGKYIVQARMNRAALLIREGNMSNTAIAEQLGYENYSYFSASFKKHFGVSPAQYAGESTS